MTHSDCLEWSAAKIIATYLLRWPVETFYQDGKSYLGLNEYRMRSAEAGAPWAKTHWCLVFVAYSFLHLACLPPALMKASLPVKTIGEACRQQAQALIEGLILYAHDQLQRGQQGRELFGRLFAKQGLAVT